MPAEEHEAPAQPGAFGQGLQNSFYRAGAGFTNSLSEDVRSTAGLAVILGLLGWLPPLIFWMMYRDRVGYEFVRANAAATFNFMVLLTVVYLVLIFIPFFGGSLFLGFWCGKLLFWSRDFQLLGVVGLLLSPFQISVLK